MATMVPTLVSPLLRAAGFRHAFFTREGGVSTGPYASLSFSIGAGDDPARVAENRRRAAAALGVEEEQLLYLSQVHGTEVHDVGFGTVHPEVVERKGDALTSRDPFTACGVRTADCVPVLLACRKTGAVGAVHAGWRGAVAGVIEAAIGVLRERHGASDLIAAIGPHIEVGAFEIGEEVAVELERAARIDRVVVREPGKKPHGDLRRFCRGALAASSVVEIDDVPGCTVTDPTRFFSYRRDGQRSGRQLSAIVARAR